MPKDERNAVRTERETILIASFVGKKGIDKNLLKKITDEIKKEKIKLELVFDIIKKLVDIWIKENNLEEEFKHIEKYSFYSLYYCLAKAEILNLNASAEEQVLIVQHSQFEWPKSNIEDSQEIIKLVHQNFIKGRPEFTWQTIQYFLLVESFKKMGFDKPIKNKELHDFGKQLWKKGKKSLPPKEILKKDWEFELRKLEANDITLAAYIIGKKGIDKNLLKKITDGIKKEKNNLSTNYDIAKELVNIWIKENNLEEEFKTLKKGGLYSAYRYLAEACILKLNVSAEEQVFIIRYLDFKWPELNTKDFQEIVKLVHKRFIIFEYPIFLEFVLENFLLIECFKKMGFDGLIKNKELHDFGKLLWKEGKESILSLDEIEEKKKDIKNYKDIIKKYKCYTVFDY